MRHAHVSEFLSEYVDGALSQADRERVKSHLVFCNGCRADLDEIARNADLLRSSVVVAPPPGLEGRIVAAMARTETAPSLQPMDLGWAQRAFSIRGFALAATCAIAGIVIWQMPEVATLNIGSSSLDESGMGRQGGSEPISVSGSEESAVPVSANPPEAGRDAARGENARQSAKASAAVLPVSSAQKASERVMSAGYSSAVGAPEEALLGARAPGESRFLKRTSAMAPPPLGAAGLGASKLVEAPALDGSNLEVRGTTSGITEPVTSVVSSEAEWESLWSRHARAFDSPPAMPAVDFAESDLLAIFAGDQPTGGIAVELGEIEETEWEGAPARLVHYSLRKPTESAFKIMVVTQPFLLKAVPRFEGRTFFRRRP